MKRVKSMILVCIDEDDSGRCDMHVTWEDGTFEVFFDGDRINMKRIMTQYFKHSRERLKQSC